MRILVLLLAVLLFGAPFVATVPVGNEFSFVLLRDAAVGAFLALYTLGSSALKANRTRLFAVPKWLLCFGVFSLYAASSLAFGGEGFDSFSLVLRLLICCGVCLAVSCVEDGVDGHKLATFAVNLFSAYCLVSIAAYPLTGGSYLEGLLSRHYTKFVALSGFVLSMCCYVQGRKDWPVLLSFVLCLATGLLVVQRGFIISAAIAGIVVFCMSRIGAIGRAKIVVVFGVCVIAGVAFVGDRIMSYAFYESVGPSEIISAVADGSFDVSMLRTRARADLADILISQGEITAFGSGAGWSKNAVARYYGTGKEPHNDLLVILFDFGLVGSALFMLFAWGFVRRCRRVYATAKGAGQMFALAGMALFAACVVWMGFSNVLIYSMAGLVFALLFLRVAERVGDGSRRRCSTALVSN